MLRHFFHDERISNDQTNDSGCVMLCALANNHPVIELDKLHQAALAKNGLYGGL
jgi:hypothetical protein